MPSSESCCALAGIRELNLRGLPVELDDLMLVVQHLPSLCVIHLSGAQKLPPSVSALFSTSPGQAQGESICNCVKCSIASCTMLTQLTGTSAQSTGFCVCSEQLWPDTGSEPGALLSADQRGAVGRPEGSSLPTVAPEDDCLVPPGPGLLAACLPCRSLDGASG